MSPRIRCATRSRRTCCAAARACAMCKSCWATPTSRRRRCTRSWRMRTCVRCTSPSTLERTERTSYRPVPDEVTEPQLTDGIILIRPLTSVDAEAHFLGEDDEQRHWFAFPRASTLDGITRFIALTQ